MLARKQTKTERISYSITMKVSYVVVEMKTLTLSRRDRQIYAKENN